MTELGLNVKGIEALKKTLKGLPGEVEDKAVQAGSLRMAGVVARQARKNHRPNVRTGRLIRSIRTRKGVVRPDDGGRTKGAKVVAGSKLVVYAPYIEFGKPGKAKAFPFLRPAFRTGQQRQVEEFGAGVKRGLVLAARAAKRKGG